MVRVKNGLDYFPVSIDMINNRVIRRVMKSEGDCAFTILISLLSCIYSGEGYYLEVDDMLYDDLADRLFTTDNDTVRSVVEKLVKYGFFDATLYEERHILTSADIQQQYRSIRKNRKILPEYNLIEEAEPAAVTAEKSESESSENRDENVPKTAVLELMSPQKGQKEAKTVHSDHKEKEKKEKENKENNLPNPPCEGGGEEEYFPSDRVKDAGMTAVSGATAVNIGQIYHGTAPAQRYTDEMISAIQPPADGVRRNLPGLIENLRYFKIDQKEQYAIILKSNYGMIGGVVWKGICQIRDSGGSIRQPGRYLLSLLQIRR